MRLSDVSINRIQLLMLATAHDLSLQGNLSSRGWLPSTLLTRVKLGILVPATKYIS